jgi:hypothetical protein
MSRLCVAFVLGLLMLTATALAQVQSRPADAPLVTAESESWYVEGEPVQFAGDLYYRAGPTVFFNGNTMVRSGHFNGVPLYSDTTLEPYSLVFVPLPRGQMQPYERLRRGDLAGTTGSRTPSFPVALTPDQRGLPMAAGAPTSVGPAGDATVAVDGAVGTRGVVSTGGIVQRTPEPTAQPVSQPVVWVPGPPDVTLRRAESNDGVWLEYAGARWLSVGRAVAFDGMWFRQIGEHAGFPVYALREGPDDLIYLVIRSGVVAPFRRK